MKPAIDAGGRPYCITMRPCAMSDWRVEPNAPDCNGMPVWSASWQIVEVMTTLFCRDVIAHI
jgi:hypothetical protein